MTVLVGGLRVLGANVNGLSSTASSPTGRACSAMTSSSNLLEMGAQVEAGREVAEAYSKARDRKTNRVKWTGTQADLIFGSHSQLRALAEVYASADAGEKFVKDFIAAWTKVMNLDRFDL